MLLYLHGFTSGPQSVKARALGARMAERGLAADFVCPQLSASPAEAILQAEQIIEHARKVGAGETATNVANNVANDVANNTANNTANNALKHSNILLVGSSLGGFYATVLAEKHNLNAVLINPAVIGQLPMEGFIGTHQWLYTGEPFEFTAQHIAELRSMDLPRVTNPQRFWLMLEEGDETLDYRQAVAYYTGAKQTVLTGGDHTFTRWADYLDAVIDASLTGRLAD